MGYVVNRLAFNVFLSGVVTDWSSTRAKMPEFYRDLLRSKIGDFIHQIGITIKLRLIRDQEVRNFRCCMPKNA